MVAEQVHEDPAAIADLEHTEMIVLPVLAAIAGLEPITMRR
jgi:hypothetical protein